MVMVADDTGHPGNTLTLYWLWQGCPCCLTKSGQEPIARHLALKITDTPIKTRHSLYEKPCRIAEVYANKRRGVFRTCWWAVVYLLRADKYPRLTRRLSQGQKGLDERALMASQRPSEPW